MTARRWIAIAVVTVMTAMGACTGSSPTGLDEREGPAIPPVQPTDTTGFVPPPGGLG